MSHLAVHACAFGMTYFTGKLISVRNTAIVRASKFSIKVLLSCLLSSLTTCPIHAPE